MLPLPSVAAYSLQIEASSMIRNSCAVLLLFILSWWPCAAHAASSAQTSRGRLVVKCSPSGKPYEGNYSYVLAGKRIPKLSSECSPGMRASYISIEQVFRSPTRTTLLVIEGVTADAQTVRVLSIPAKGAIEVVDLLGGDGYALVEKSPTLFRLTAPGGGFALSDKYKSTWTCVVELDFAKGIASGNIAVPHERGLPQSVCQPILDRIQIP